VWDSLKPSRSDVPRCSKRRPQEPGATAPSWSRSSAGLESADVLVVTPLDRLARSTRDLLNVLDELAKRGVGFRSLKDAWADTTTPTPSAAWQPPALSSTARPSPSEALGSALRPRSPGAFPASARASACLC